MTDLQSLYHDRLSIPLPWQTYNPFTMTDLQSLLTWQTFNAVCHDEPSIHFAIINICFCHVRPAVQFAMTFNPFFYDRPIHFAMRNLELLKFEHQSPKVMNLSIAIYQSCDKNHMSISCQSCDKKEGDKYGIVLIHDQIRLGFKLVPCKLLVIVYIVSL